MQSDCYTSSNLYLNSSTHLETFVSEMNIYSTETIILFCIPESLYIRGV